MKIVSRVETISPQTAEKYLSRNVHNRPIQASRVELYANAMIKNQWLITHQGIAFNDKDELMDGQQRLLAIVKAGIPVSVMVTRGIPAGRDNGIQLNTMDVIDCGRARTVADQLSLSHGITNANVTAAIIATIIRIALNGQCIRLTTPVAVAVNEMYKKEIEHFIHASSKLFKSSAILGSLAFASKTNHQAEAFMNDICSGESLQRNSPALTFRNWVINGGPGRIHGGGHERNTIAAGCTLKALYNYVQGEKLEVIRYGYDTAQSWFRSRQRANVDRIVSLTGVQPIVRRKNKRGQDESE